MAKNPLSQVRLNEKRYDLESLHNEKQRLHNDMLDAIFLKNYVFAYDEEYQHSHDKAKSHQAGLDTLPKDNPATSRDEAVSFNDLRDIANKIYKDKISGGMSPDEVFDAALKESEDLNFNSGQNLSIRQLTSGENPNSLALKILRIIGQQSSVDSEITDTENDISNMTNELKSE